MKLIFRIFNLILLIVIVYFGYAFFHTVYLEKNKGVSIEQAIKTGALNTVSKARPIVEGVASIFDGVDYKSADAQSAFIKTRGIPDIYTIFFSDAEFDEKGRVVQKEETRRIDTWFYDGPYDSVVSFDNGFFVEEKDIKDSIDLKEHSISPLFFTSTTKPEDVTGLLGFPDCAEEFKTEGDIIVTIKYNITPERPLVSVSFSDDKIISATVGIAFMKEGATGNVLCPF